MKAPRFNGPTTVSSSSSSCSLLLSLLLFCGCFGDWLSDAFGASLASPLLVLLLRAASVSLLLLSRVALLLSESMNRFVEPSVLDPGGVPVRVTTTTPFPVPFPEDAPSEIVGPSALSPSSLFVLSPFTDLCLNVSFARVTKRREADRVARPVCLPSPSSSVPCSKLRSFQCQLCGYCPRLQKSHFVGSSSPVLSSPPPPVNWTPPGSEVVSACRCAADVAIQAKKMILRRT